ncbi:allophanate hydrolase subunit 1 [uncultured Pseudokineococcus sp.]|uniref:5-oxoprolinase subunit B family protein n=1 Tax=uncultured Pseudokineococcus sp. TaxID=1642928 RepID=UPI00261983F3|nr:allophanate hydrolase subunit 1 [uncultured Pseudokineococcus sp.]
MRVLPCGTSGLLVELDALDDVLALYAALEDDPPAGVLDLVPAARTLLLHLDPEAGDAAAVEAAVRGARTRRGVRGTRAGGDLVEVPVVYDGEDLEEIGELTGWGADGVVERHTAQEWTVAFCGFAPGFGYLVADGDEEWQVPRRSSPRTRVPAGSVALAGEFTGVYPRESPGGWQLLGRTDLPVFDLDRDPPALLVPGARVRFTAVRAGS